MLQCDDAVRVRLLCHWAVSAQRTGTYRSMAVVRLLEKRCSDIAELTSNSYPFHRVLFEFLNTEAPVPGRQCYCAGGGGVLPERTPKSIRKYTILAKNFAIFMHF